MFTWLPFWEGMMGFFVMFGSIPTFINQLDPIGYPQKVITCRLIEWFPSHIIVQRSNKRKSYNPMLPWETYIHYITFTFTLHYITLHYIYITLHYIYIYIYITLHHRYITLHYITLHHITLHYITYTHTYIYIHMYIYIYIYILYTLYYTCIFDFPSFSTPK